MKQFVIGDIHGGYKALIQCLNRADFSYDNDYLIVLGDVVDGWSETAQVVNELLKIKNLIYVIGNHDLWAMDWLEYGATPPIWTEQGGRATIKSYIDTGELTNKEHLKFFKSGRKYYIDDDNRVYVHGGFNPSMPIEEQHIDFLTWDRTLVYQHNNDIDISPYTEAFIGHTSIWGLSKLPLCRNKVWFMDTGAGWEGKLSIMNVETKQVFQSDRVSNLYPEERGR